MINAEDEDDKENAYEDAKEALAEWDNENGDELKLLEDFNEEGSSESTEWTYGTTLIHDDFWVNYVMDLLIDIGDLPRDIPHYIVIDWEATGENIKVDYTEIDFGGYTYYMRSC